MLVVETIARIRRDDLVRGVPIKKIARDLRVSKNTMRKVVRGDETSYSYARKIQPLPKLGPWVGELERRLEANEKKSRRDRLSLLRIHEGLSALGYGGGYDAVRRYARTWRRRWRLLSPSQGFVPLSFDPGEAYQFDWSHGYARLSGVTTKVKAAHIRLCDSRMQLVQIFPRESQEMVFEAHERAFHFFGGVCRRGIYDNMKTAVSMVFVGKERAYNRRFLELCSHHLVEPVACTPGAGWEKGQVERQVGDVRGRLFVPIPRGRSYAEINAWLMDRCIEDAKKRPHPMIEGKTVWQVFEEERPFLMAYRGPFDGFHATEVSVPKTCLVRFDTVQGFPCCYHSPLPCVLPPLPRRNRPVLISLTSRSVAAFPEVAIRSASASSRFEACSAFTHVAARVVAEPPKAVLLSECVGLCRYLHRPLRLLPAGTTVTGRDSRPLSTAHATFVRFGND